MNVNIWSFKFNKSNDIYFHSEFQKNYKSDIWGYNGLELLMRVLQKFCKTNDLTKMNRQTCHGFHVYPEKTFYPLYGLPFAWAWYTSTTSANITMVQEKMKDSFALHLNNSESKAEIYKIRQGDAYDLVARKNCPLIYADNVNFWESN